MILSQGDFVVDVGGMTWADDAFTRLGSLRPLCWRPCFRVAGQHGPAALARHDAGRDQHRGNLCRAGLGLDHPDRGRSQRARLRTAVPLGDLVKPSRFGYVRPADLDDALAVLAVNPQESKILAGGQSLVPMMNFRHSSPEQLIDINQVPGLSGLRSVSDQVEIGTLTRHLDVQQSEFPGPVGSLLRRAARHIGHLPIRTRGTFGGSLAHCDATSEWCLVTRLLDAKITVRSHARGERMIPAADFFLSAFTTALEPDEILTGVSLRALDDTYLTGFAKFARRGRQSGNGIVIVATMVQVVDGVIGDARVCLGGVAGIPFRSTAAEDVLYGAQWSSSLVADAAEAAAAEVDPPSDIHGDAEYRRDLVRALLPRALGPDRRLRRAGGIAKSGPGTRAPAALRLPSADPMMWTGRPLPRLEDPALLRGWGNYVADIAAGDKHCLRARFVRSPVAHGRLISVTAPAGMILYTAADLADVRPIHAVLDRPDFVGVDTPILAHGEVRFVGEPIALLLADSEAAAEDALELVGIEIEPLPAVLSAEEAVRPGAPLVHDVQFPSEANTVVDARIHTSGFDDAWQRADAVVDVRVSSARQSAMPLEARAAHVSYDRASGRSTLHATVQMPHVIKTGITTCLGIAEDDLRVVAPDVGGGFGAKMTLAREDVALVWASRRLRRGVAWIETRDENFQAAWHSREQVYDVQGAFTAAGELLALRGDLVCDVGAYSCYPVTWGVEPLMAMAELPGCYRVGEYSVRARGIATNKCPIAPYRGVSRPMQVLALERLLDVAAGRLGLDPVTIRRVNLVSEFPHRTPTGLVLDEASHLHTLTAAAEAADIADFRTRQEQARAQGRYLGLGISCFAERTGYGTPAFAARSRPQELTLDQVPIITPGFERVILSMDPSGGVTLRIGASPHGQGLKTTLAQLIADELGLSPKQIRVIASDTDATPYGWGSFASRAMVIAGGAALLASRDLADRLRTLAAHRLGALPADVELVDGLARRVDGGSHPGGSVPLRVLARDTYHNAQLIPDKGEPALEAVGVYDPSGTFANACHIAEVEVDAQTGGVRIARYQVAEDAGRLINPAIVDGQIHGGIVQGLGNALYEELIYDENGALLTTSLSEYLPPTVLDVPIIDIVHMQTLSPATVTGAKGVGEGGTIGAPAAIANAISDALAPLGVGVFHLPATPHRIRDAIRHHQDLRIPQEPGSQQRKREGHR